MSSETLTEATLKMLRLNQVRAYAERRGWQRGPTFRGVLEVFDRGGGSLEQLLVPTNPGLDDFAEQMQRVVVRLAQSEGRHPASVLEDLISLDVDTVRFSLRSPDAERGTIPLEQGLDLIDGARRSLLAAACTVLAPSNPYHPRMSRGDAEDFIRACELGQTERGSYTVTLKCPMHAPLSADEPADDEVPFARKATETLATSVFQIAQAIDRDRVDAVLQGPVDGVQVTANLCDALLRMQPERDNSALAFSVTWASSRPSRITSAAVVLRNEHFPFISFMSQRLRGTAVSEVAPFIAHVDELRGAIGADGRRHGEVRLTLYHEDEAFKARATLSSDQYDLAVRAHIAGRYVCVRGVLTRASRVATLGDVDAFDLLQQPQGAAQQSLL